MATHDENRCDVPGCGLPSEILTDGSEVDEQKVDVRFAVFVQADDTVTASSTGKPGEVKGEIRAERGLGRPSIPHLHLCHRHRNWSHSGDARALVDGSFEANSSDVAAHTAFRKAYAARKAG